MELKLKEKYADRMGRFNSFEDKVQLIQAVKAQPIIWDFNHKNHYNSTFVNTAWEAIAVELQKEANVCKNAWRSLRDSLRYHTKTATSKRKRRGAGGRDVGVPKASDEVDWSFGPHMSFLTDLLRQRRTTQLPKKPSPTSSTLNNIEDSQNMYAEYLEDDFSTSSFEHSSKYEEELDRELNKELEMDLENESSSSNSYEPLRKKINAADSCPLTQKFIEYVDIQKNLLTQPPKIRSMCTYWGDIIQDLPKDVQDEAEQKVTQLLYDLRKKAKAME